MSTSSFFSSLFSRKNSQASPASAAASSLPTWRYEGPPDSSPPFNVQPTWRYGYASPPDTSTLSPYMYLGPTEPSSPAYTSSAASPPQQKGEPRAPALSSSSASAVHSKKPFVATPEPHLNTKGPPQPSEDKRERRRTVAPADRPSALEAAASSLVNPTAAAVVSPLHRDKPVVQTQSTLLERGHQFTALVGVNPTLVHRVFVWYDSKDAKMGTLYWNISKEGLKRKSPDLSIPFHLISDIFMGKQSLEFKSPEGSSYDSSHCFSIASKDRSLHLAAESEAVRLDFISSIKQIFMQSDRRVDEERAELEKKNVALTKRPSLNLPLVDVEALIDDLLGEQQRTTLMRWVHNTIDDVENSSPERDEHGYYVTSAPEDLFSHITSTYSRAVQQGSAAGVLSQFAVMCAHLVLYYQARLKASLTKWGQEDTATARTGVPRQVVQRMSLLLAHINDCKAFEAHTEKLRSHVMDTLQPAHYSLHHLSDERLNELEKLFDDIINRFDNIVEGFSEVTSAAVQILIKRTLEPLLPYLSASFTAGHVQGVEPLQWLQSKVLDPLGVSYEEVRREINSNEWMDTFVQESCTFILNLYVTSHTHNRTRGLPQHADVATHLAPSPYPLSCTVSGPGPHHQSA